MQALPLVPKLQKCTRKLASYIQLVPGAWQPCRVQKRVPTALSSGWVQQGTAGGPRSPGCRTGRRERAGAELHPAWELSLQTQRPGVV